MYKLQCTSCHTKWYTANSMTDMICENCKGELIEVDENFPKIDPERFRRQQEMMMAQNKNTDSE
ncbi:hypothetical protein [Clostridium grantii]|uniref:Uncharacterized protein n=1 Tax=Clostridium grantii DSM 8605 TaxID=1121316 RepID=A0A1M5UP47_9CLOT|nr:hypothetical protein [Clostridium grantii]SHH64710.1 hypothetical protein SAMN02745207_01856 [Clostridium grantii DSM 8605]